MYMKKGKPLVFNSPQHLKGVRSSPTTLFQKPTLVDTHGCEYPFCARCSIREAQSKAPLFATLWRLYSAILLKERKG